MRLNSKHAYALALVLGALPLWIGGPLPLVDLPQHLHLISVLHRLDDPSTLYPQLFEARHTLTPYLGYYYAVSALNWLLPLEIANRIFLTVYVIGLPLALGFLLRGLHRPRWASVLAIPFAYGDSFGWGFINYCVALPLAILTLGLFVRALDDAARRRTWAAWSAAALVATLLFHIQAFGFLGLALPFLLLSTRVEPGGGLKARVPALVSTVPALLLFLATIATRLGQPGQVERGAPWKAWGPLLSPENLGYLPFSENLHRLLPSLGNLLRDGSDHWGANAALGVALVAWLWAAGTGRWRNVSFRLLGLSALALGCYFVLPFDVRGYLYYLNPRYAHLFAGLWVVSVPALTGPCRGRFLWVGTLTATLTSFALVRGFHAFAEEAQPLAEMVSHTGPKPVVMGLIFDAGSHVRTHPVFLHSASVLARMGGGTSHFSFALQPHIPIGYRVTPPRAPASEWRPDQFRYETMGADYDHFLLRAVRPEQTLGAPLARGELSVVAQSQGWTLVRRNRSP